jgi:drug/metabolite transporter (DMT)-like permease
MEPYLYALSANLFFALGSIFFTHYARKFSSLWMNTYKAIVAMTCFLLMILLTTGFHEISLINVSIFFISGFISLGIGDIFLIQALSLIGPGRTLLLFGFHPLVVGGISYFAFGQNVETSKLYGIVFFILCLITFSYESFKKSGHWEVKGLLFALSGMLLDAIGVTITRHAFDMNASISSFEGNFYRCIGAICAYMIIRQYYPIEFRVRFKSLTSKSKLMVTIGALSGTFISLSFYLEAVKTAHLASISAIAITSVIFSSLFEAIWEKKWPSKYLYIAFVFFAFGMYFILFS